MHYYYPFYYDSTYILIVIGFIISMAASAHVKSVFNRYARVGSQLRLTGAQVAERMLAANGVAGVRVQPVRGSLTDNYNPMNKTVNLSESVYASTSIAALGVAAHECGHAMQHNVGYIPLSLRSAILPVANFGSRLGIPVCIVGMLIGGAGSTIVKIGILLFVFAVLFQLVTLPVEFNASRRALTWLEEGGILTPEELKGTRAVLMAAAMTYVAAASASILQLLRLVLIFGGGRRRD
ncbi:zinc metallopeptidase [Lachnospiraceae bacterium C1.1]|nr:zinc metallopeptidase [Lachnospiraceae bacterium C1.1]